MYTDKEFSTFNILCKTLKRNLLGEENPLTDNYMIGEIYPPSLLNPDVLRVGMGYLYHETKYKLAKALGVKDITDETVPLAISSGLIMDNVGHELGQPLLLRKGTFRVAYNQAETEEMKELQILMEKYGISCRDMSAEEAEKETGTRIKTGEGGSVWFVEGDGNVIPNIIQVLIDAFKSNGGTVIPGYVSKIYQDPLSRQLSGVQVTNGEEKLDLSASHFMGSFGAKGGVKGRHEPVIPGTGYSGFLVVDGKIKHPIDSNNSHFTPIANKTLEDGKEVTLVKATSGGVIGTEQFCRDHAFNNLHYADKIIFPDKKIEIIAARACSRPLNGKNSAKLQEILPNAFVATGFGGKGITDAAGFAVKEVIPAMSASHVAKETIRRFAQDLLKKAPEGKGM
jgi:glycine/D-amino acid oxidase-like deaminating enzyme